MIISPILNSVTFKKLEGELPNRWDTLHSVRKHGGFSIIPYCQKFDKNDIIYLQFISDSETIPNLKIYYPNFKESIEGTLLKVISGEDTRYYYGFEILLDSTFYDKIFFCILTQNDTILTSEPVICEDLSEAIFHGILKKIKYTNFDRGDSDLNNFFVDWSVTEFMYFFVEAVDLELNDSGETEIITGVQSKDIAASSLYSGVVLQTNGIPDYVAMKLAAASSLDYFEVNKIQYIKDSLETSRSGNSTLFNCTLKLTQKHTIGLNVDDYGENFIDQNTIPMAIIVKRNTGATGAGWSVENPAGYMLHSIFIKHAATSAGDAVVKLGTTIGGSEIIDEVQGSIPLSQIWESFPRHFLKTAGAASNMYFTISGAGVVLDIIVNFDIIIQQ